MKKVLSIIGIILAFFIIYFLQSNFFSWFNIAGIKPNLFVILILVIGLFTGKKIGMILGIIFGLYIDLLIGRIVGISAILFGIIGFVAEYVDNNFSKKSRLTMMLMVIAATVFYEVGAYIYSIVILNIPPEIFSFIKILVIEIIYNCIIIIMVYPIVQKIGNKLENIFKTKTILTKYF